MMLDRPFVDGIGFKSTSMAFTYLDSLFHVMEIDVLVCLPKRQARERMQQSSCGLNRYDFKQQYLL